MASGRSPRHSNDFELISIRDDSSNENGDEYTWSQQRDHTDIADTAVHTDDRSSISHNLDDSVNVEPVQPPVHSTVDTPALDLEAVGPSKTQTASLEYLASPDTSTVPRPINRFASTTILLRLALNVGVAILSLCFVVFASLAKSYNNEAMSNAGSEELLAAAQFVRPPSISFAHLTTAKKTKGPTIFAIIFAAIVGRFLKSIAATLPERSTTIGLVECLLGGRTVAGATFFPFSAKFLHPVMLLLMLLWSLSPLGGQAALRVVSRRTDVSDVPSTFHFLDTRTSPSMIVGASARQSYANAILSAFNSALSSPVSSRTSSQDLYGNLKIPLIEALKDNEKDGDSWHIISPDSEVTYSSLAGLPYLGTDPSTEASFNIQSSYMKVECSLSLDTQEQRFFQDIVGSNKTFPTNQTSSIITNEMHLAFTMDKGRETSIDRPLEVTMLSESFSSENRSSLWQLTTAVCEVTTSYVEMQVSCRDDVCSTAAIRASTLSHPSSNLTFLDGSFAPDAENRSTLARITQENFYLLMINSTTQDPNNVHITQPSPFQHFFVNPESPFSQPIDQVSPTLYQIGDALFSLRLTQLLNTLWLDSVAPFALTGNFTSPSNALYSVATVEGTLSTTQEVLHCDDGWLAVLFLTSFVVLSAAVGTAVLDAPVAAVQNSLTALSLH